MDKTKIIEAFSELLGIVIDQNKNTEQVELVKSLEEEERTALFVVLQPDVFDLHGDIYDKVSVSKAAANFHRFCNKPNIQHSRSTDAVEILESYVAPSDMILSNDKVVTEGTWLQKWYFKETEEGNELLRKVKNGEFTGLSVGCKARVGEV